MNSARWLLESSGSAGVTESWAPGRVNIIGEHTDYNGGLVLPMAIHLGVSAAVGLRSDSRIVMRSAQMPDEIITMSEAASLRPGTLNGWSAYVAGAVWSIGRHIDILPGLDIAIDGNVPLGAGLSSSAAVECAVIVALADLLDVPASPRDLARWAQEAENEFVGVPTGSMDQVASMMSQAGHALLFDVSADSTTHIPVNLTRAAAEFLIVDTRAAHALVDGGYADRRRTCEAAADWLGVPSLRDIGNLEAALERLNGTEDSVRMTARVRHVHTENDRVIEAVEALHLGDLFRLGELLNASHRSLRDDFEVSCPELDCAVSAALHGGALGARMMGGGFGGSALVLTPHARRRAVIDEIRSAFLECGYVEPGFHAVSPGRGAHVIDSRHPGADS